MAAVPAITCPPVAVALGGAGLGPACQAIGAAGGVASGAAAQAVGLGVGPVLDAVAGWVSSGAVWLLGQVGAVLSATTSVDLGASWFAAHYRTMAGLAGVVIVPLLLAGVIQAVHRQSPSLLLRSVVVNVPLALLLTAVATQLVQLGLALTDAMSQAVAAGAGLDTGHAFDGVITALGGPTGVAGPGTPTFVALLGGLAVVVGAFLLWVELVIRAAAVYVAVLFLPLALASLAWPAVAHWCRRLVDTLAALVLGKFVIVAVLSLAAGALAAGTGATPAGGVGGGGTFAGVVAGAALLLLAAAAPWVLFRLLPFLEAGAVAHLEGAGRRATQGAAAPVRGLAETALRVPAVAAAGEGLGGVGTALAAGSATGDGPDLGPSSLERTGVGTASPPGSSIPRYPSTPGAEEAFGAHLARLGLDPDGSPLEPEPGGDGHDDRDSPARPGAALVAARSAGDHATGPDRR